MATRNATNTAEFRRLKTGTCPSLSGRSTLTYEIACGPGNDLQLRIVKNSAKGYFSAAWVRWVDLQAVLDKNGKQPITCHTLGPLFKGLSVNTSGFLLAALKEEGLVQHPEDQPRTYERTDPTAFYAEMKSLLTGGKPKAAKPVKAVPNKTKPKA